MSYIIEGLEVMVYSVPTDGPESDGTLEWNSTTLVLVKVRSADVEGLGYTYGHAFIVAWSKVLKARWQILARFFNHSL